MLDDLKEIKLDLIFNKEKQDYVFELKAKNRSFSVETVPKKIKEVENKIIKNKI